MTVDDLNAALPDYAKDLRLNLDSVLSGTATPGLEPRHVAAVALASAIAARHAPLTATIAAWAAQHADAATLDDARTAAAIMAMNNMYYRFVHLVGDAEYATLRAGLRMNALARPASDKVTLELASLAVSAINGCGQCLTAHEQTLRQHGLGAQAVQSAARVAAVVHAVAVTLEQAAVAEAPVAA